MTFLRESSFVTVTWRFRSKIGPRRNHFPHVASNPEIGSMRRSGYRYTGGYLCAPFSSHPFVLEIPCLFVAIPPTRTPFSGSPQISEEAPGPHFLFGCHRALFCARSSLVGSLPRFSGEWTHVKASGGPFSTVEMKAVVLTLQFQERVFCFPPSWPAVLGRPPPSGVKCGAIRLVRDGHFLREVRASVVGASTCCAVLLNPCLQAEGPSPLMSPFRHSTTPDFPSFSSTPPLQLPR